MVLAQFCVHWARSFSLAADLLPVNTLDCRIAFSMVNFSRKERKRNRATQLQFDDGWSGTVSQYLCALPRINRSTTHNFILHFLIATLSGTILLHILRRQATLEDNPLVYCLPCLVHATVTCGFVSRFYLTFYRPGEPIIMVVTVMTLMVCMWRDIVIFIRT